VHLDELHNQIHRFTKDAILVTEAEPVDEPGPRIVFANRAFEEATGYTQEEILGRSPRFLQGEGTCPLTLARIRKALDEWRPIQEELLNYTKDGTPFWIEISLVPVADETGWFRYWVSVQRDVSARKRIEAALVEQRDSYRRASLVDELTGLLNRRGLKAAAVAASRNTATRPIFLLAIDLDRFKQLNDTLGHDAGDAVLNTVAERLKSAATPGDLLARMGGDEFMVLDTAPSRIPPMQRAGQIQAALSRPVMHGRTSIGCHASVGIATGSWEDYDSGALFRRADLALYAAKAEGRGRAAVFAPEMERRFLDRMALASDLQFALEHEGFSVAYMPKVHATSRQLIGFEALARWSHPVHGDVPPATFIGLAEDLKIVEEIDAFVLRTVAEDRRRYERNGRSLPPISVNVSARRLHDDRFVDDIERLDLTGSDISVELLETVILDHVEDRTLDTLDKLRWRGIHVEIDDFGSGHASILSLTQIKPECLKLDRRFAQDILSDRRTLDIVRSAVSMAKALDIRVVAEGVETVAQADLLASLGCFGLQGFLFGHPADLDVAVLGCAADAPGVGRRAG
jgi:diguanylate cyclase (GGDEF)-like protein/PAS domain S-box-containing protein